MSPEPLPQNTLEFFTRSAPERDYGELSECAARIEKLLARPAIRENPNVVACLDDLLGAVYALIFARGHDFTDRKSGQEPEIGPIETRARQIAGGRIRTDGKWMAGFHFNSALFRTAAVGFRTLKTFYGKEEKKYENFPGLVAKAKEHHPSWKSDKLELTYKEVNELKHTAEGVRHGRNASYCDGLDAVRELLEIIEVAGVSETDPSLRSR